MNTNHENRQHSSNTSDIKTTVLTSLTTPAATIVKKTVLSKTIAQTGDYNNKTTEKINQPTRVVNIYHFPNGFPKENGFIKVMRPSKWGNPFRITTQMTREKVVENYREWIMKQPHLLNSLHELRGKTLGCCCKPKACHADVLAELADKNY